MTVHAEIGVDDRPFLEACRRTADSLLDLDLEHARVRRRVSQARFVGAVGLVLACVHAFGIFPIPGFWWRVPGVVGTMAVILELDLQLGLAWAKAKRRRARAAQRGAFHGGA